MNIHTTGNWNFNLHRYPNGKLSGRPYVYASNCGHEHGHVCQVFFDDTAPPEVQAMQEANGKLIAAAPQLLAACQLALESFGGSRPDDGAPASQREFDVLTKAIAATQ